MPKVENAKHVASFLSHCILGTTLKDSVDYYGINWSSWYFQQDNDPKHKSKSTLKWLQDNRVNVISDWPAQSPDLNPMEHIWRQLKLNLSLYKTHAKDTQELWERIEKEWNKFDKDLCCKYIDTMPDRIRAVIKSKGGYEILKMIWFFLLQWVKKL